MTTISTSNTSGNSAKVTWNDTSGNSIQIKPEGQNFTVKANPFSPTPSSQTDRCGEPTLADGTRCELEPNHDDGCCHWHTSEQCYRPTDDGTPCELPGSQPDGACHVHTSGCNEKLRHNAVEKAAYHGMKYSYRMLGLHPDTDRSGGLIDIMPESAATVAAEVGKGILEALDEEYDREESHEYYEKNIVTEVTDDDSVIERIKSVFDYREADDEEVAVDVLKEGIKQMWTQVDDKEHHADAARTAVAAAEYFLNTRVEVQT